jgi:hypothetical protein
MALVQDVQLLHTFTCLLLIVIQFFKGFFSFLLCLFEVCLAFVTGQIRFHIKTTLLSQQRDLKKFCLVFVPGQFRIRMKTTPIS